MKTPLYILIVCVVAVASQVSEGDDNSAALPDLALQPPRVTAEFDPDTVKSTRGAQGVPAIERAANGRLWAAWYAGPSPRGVESSRSYVVLATSGDDGVTWSEQLLVRARRFVHTYDPCLWIDPQRRLWFFWAQSAGVQDGRMGVWAMVTTDADSETPEWSQPRRIANGVMLNKPTVLKNGDWLLPVGLWRDNTNVPNVKFDAEELAPYTIKMLTHDLGDERGSNVYRSTDQGKSFQRIGQVRIPGTRVDEHMIVERGDGSLWMLLRNTGGIAQSVSTDGGRTWSDGSLYLQGRTFANKRFFIRRLKSGALHLGSLQPLLQLLDLFTQQLGRRVFVAGLRLGCSLLMPLSETSGRNPDRVRCGLERITLLDHKIDSILLELITERPAWSLRFL